MVSVDLAVTLGVVLGIGFGLPAFIIMIYLCTRCIVVERATAVVVERWGRFDRVLEPGLHCLRPFADRARSMRWRVADMDVDGRVARVHWREYDTYRIDMRESVMDFPNQEIITRDNVEITVHPMMIYRIEDPVRAVYETYDLADAVEKLVRTTLRSIIGDMGLDDTLASREEINRVLMQKISNVCFNWGLRLLKIDLLEIQPTPSVMEAMHKQLKAERFRRSNIIRADGEREATKLQSEGTCQQQIALSTGEQQVLVTRARGQAEARIIIAEAEAEAVRLVGEALQGSNVTPHQYLVALRYLDAFNSLTAGADRRIVLFPFENDVVGGLVGRSA